MMKKMNIELTTRVKKAYAVTMLTTMIAFSFSGIGSTVAYISTNATVSSLNFSGLQNTYPSNSKWNSSFMNKAWQCHGFACTLGYSLSGKDPYTWTKTYSLDDVKPGDIIRFNRPHSIMVTAVNGSEITYVDCNWVAKNTVKWNQKIQKNKKTSKWGSLNYVMKYPN